VAIVSSPALVITPADAALADFPLIGWDNKVVLNNVVAEHENAAYPATNLANPATNLKWLSDSTAEQLVTVSNLEGESDYVGLARHNLGSGEVEVAVEAITAEPGAVWTEVLAGAFLGADSPAILRFAKGHYTGIRLRLTPDTEEPSIAVLYVGELLTMSRGIQAGYTPLTDAREVNVVNGRSEAGEHLGAIVNGAVRGSAATFRAIEAAWYRANLREFVAAANEGLPFFFAWMPDTYPEEVAFAWLNSTARPVINYLGGRQHDITLDMGALAL
jgi:hypothetical protein